MVDLLVKMLCITEFFLYLCRCYHRLMALGNRMGITSKACSNHIDDGFCGWITPVK